MRFVSLGVAAKTLDMSIPTLRRNFKAGNLPAPVRVGRRLKYDLDELVQAVKTKRQQ